MPVLEGLLGHRHEFVHMVANLRWPGRGPELANLCFELLGSQRGLRRDGADPR